MKAIMLKQPYASLMLYGKVETRTWKTNVRGEILICASKISYSIDGVIKISGYNQLKRIFSTLGIKHIGDLPTGCKIGTGNLTLCKPMELIDENKCFVRFQENLWCHFYNYFLPVANDPIKGSQGFFNVN